MKEIVLITTITSMCLIGCSNQDPAIDTPSQETPAAATTTTEEPDTTVTHLDAEAAAKMLAENPELIVLDVRTPGEYAEGHIADAVNIDFRSDDFEQKIAELDPANSYLVHCRSGGRSTSSLEVFKKLNFASIYHLDGGIADWEKASQPLVK